MLFSFMEGRPIHAREDSVPDWDVPLQANTAVFVDAPGSKGVAIGLCLAARGYRPIPLYNGCPSMAAAGSSEWAPTVVEVTRIMAALLDGAETLVRYGLPASAPPAFLLDANRAAARPGLVPYKYFDNRSFVSALDVPSGSFLKDHGIDRIVVVHEKSTVQPDLLLILLEWQHAGVQIFFQAPWLPWRPQPLKLKRPPAIVSMYRRLRMRLGYRRNHLDAFGVLVHPVTSGSG
ncbi:MAG: hypothetical protein ABSG65_31965 [Bryobacteraceae bacterium]